MFKDEELSDVTVAGRAAHEWRHESLDIASANKLIGRKLAVSGYFPPVCTENLGSGVVMVKTAKDGV